MRVVFDTKRTHQGFVADWTLEKTDIGFGQRLLRVASPMKKLVGVALTVALLFALSSAPGQDVAGIGVVLGADGTNLVVKDVLSNSPAAIANSIHPGDRILSIGADAESAVPTQKLKLIILDPQGTVVQISHQLDIPANVNRLLNEG